MFMWPKSNRVQITRDTSEAHRVQHVLCHVVRRDSSPIHFGRVNVAFNLSFVWMKDGRKTAINFGRVNIAFIFSVVWMKDAKKPEYLEKPSHVHRDIIGNVRFGRRPVIGGVSRDVTS